MTPEQKKYIEENINLIENNKWDEFFNSPKSIGIGGVLYEAGITFLDELTYVPTRAFLNCSNLNTIIIPGSVTSIGNSAFSDCSGNIIKINYGGTTDEWKQLIGENNRVFRGTKYICNCTNGVVKKSR